MKFEQILNEEEFKNEEGYKVKIKCDREFLGHGSVTKYGYEIFYKHGWVSKSGETTYKKPEDCLEQAIEDIKEHMRKQEKLYFRLKVV